MFMQLHPNIRVRLVLSFLSRVIGSMIFPFMAIYFTNKFGAVQAGILIMIQIIIQFATGLYAGHCADILGRKKMMMLGEGVKVIAFLGMVLVNSPIFVSAEITFVMTLLIGVSSGLINPAAEAMLIDVSTKDTRAYMYSINYWSINLSIMIGIMVGGWFFKNHFFGLLMSLFAMAVITLVLTGLLIRETLIKENRTKQGIRKEYGVKSLIKSYSRVIGDVRFLLFTLGGIAIMALEFQRDKFIGVRLDQEFIPRTLSFFKWAVHLDGVKLMSLLCVENTLLIVLLTAPVTRWIKNRRTERIMYIGVILFGLGFAVLAFSNNAVVLALAVFVLTCGELLYVPTRQSLLADIIDDTKRGAYMAFNSLVYQFGKMFGAFGLMIGGKIGGYGMAAGFLIFTVVAILLSRAALRRKRPASEMITKSGARFLS